MKGILTLALAFVVSGWMNCYSQIRTITGTLTSGEGGEPLPGVNIMIKGTETGTVTDVNGYYSITAPVGSTLVFSFIGMQTREVLVTNETTHGKKPRKIHKKLIVSQTDPPFIADTIPGNTIGVGVLLDNTPAYKGASPINVNALKKIKRIGDHYVIRYHDTNGASGPFAIQYTSAVTAERISKMPELQKNYGQGQSINGGLAWTGPESGIPFAWGPAVKNLEFDGALYPFDKNGALTLRGSGNGKPAKNYDPLSFFHTGWSLQNSLGISTPLANATMLASIENLKREGVLPNSLYNHTNLSARILRIALAPRLHINTHILFNRSEGNLLNRGANMATLMGNILLTPPTFDNSNGLSPGKLVRTRSSWLTPDGNMRSYAPETADNPYAMTDLLPDHERMKRVMTQMNLRYHDKDNIFNLVANGSIDRQSNEIIHGIPAGFAAYPEGRLTDRSDDQRYSHFIITPEYTWNDGSTIKVNSSYQIHHWHRQLIRNDQFSLTKSFNDPWQKADSSIRTSVTTSRFVHELSFNASFDNWYWLSLRASAKKYFSNTLPASSYTNFFPSVSFSIDLAEPLNSVTFDDIEIFGSSARTIRQAPMIYSNWSYASTAMDMNEYYRFFENTEIIPKDLLPEIEDKYETGILINANQHISLKATYFNNLTKNFLTPVSAPEGFRLDNAASVNNYGTTLTLSFNRWANFNQLTWRSALTWSSYRSVVEKLNHGRTHIAIGGFRNIQTVLAEGQPFGAIWGTGWARNASGSMVIDADGFPLKDPAIRKIGDPTPEWTMGWSSYVKWKTLSISFAIDVRKGGDMWNGTRAALDYAGLSAETGNLRGVTDYTFEGVTQEGNPNNITVDFYDTTKPVEFNRWTRYGFDGVGESYIEDASWIRLQDITLGYTLSKNSHHSTIKEIRFSITGRNLILITPYSGVDPANSLFGYSANSGLDLFNSPATRSYNAQITLKI